MENYTPAAPGSGNLAPRGIAEAYTAALGGIRASQFKTREGLLNAIHHVLTVVDRADLTEDKKSTERVHFLVRNALRSAADCPAVMGVIVDYQAIIAGLFHVACMSKLACSSGTNFMKQVEAAAVDYSHVYHKCLEVQANDGALPTEIGLTIVRGTLGALECDSFIYDDPIYCTGKVVAMVSVMADRME